MDINYPPEFDPVLESYLTPVAEEIKRLELTRRWVTASAARTEKERADIINFSSAFMYEIRVTAGIISLERNPHFENNQLIDDIIIETRTMLQTILPEKIDSVMGEVGPELAEMIRPQIVEEIRSLLGGAYA